MPTIAPTVGAPEAGARHDDVGLDHSVGGAHAGDPAAGLLDADHPGGALEPGSARLGARARGRPPRAWPSPGRRSACAGRRGHGRGPAGGGAGRTPPASTSVASTPHDVSHPCRRCRSVEPLGGRGDLQPADLLEAPRAVEVEARRTCRRCRSRTRVIVFDGLTWNTSPGAWEVEPPVSGSGPWSTTVTRSMPRSVSSSARLVPTTPAPMITTRGVVDMVLLVSLTGGGIGRSGSVGSAGGAVLGRGVEQPVGQVAGERRAHQRAGSRLPVSSRAIRTTPA